MRRSQTVVMNAEASAAIHAAQEEKQKLEDLFNEMDLDSDGQVTKEELARYLHINHNQWPLGELLSVSSESTKTEIVNFWHRQIADGKDAFKAPQLFQFLKAIQQHEVQEATYADLLLELFDRNFDGNLNRYEYAKMLTTLLGQPPSSAALKVVGSDGLDKNKLKALLNRAGGDFTKLDPSYGTKQNSNRGDTLLAVSLFAVSVVAGGVFYWKFIRPKL